jgi:hypothetical protein
MPIFSTETATVSTTSSSGSVGRSAGRGSITVLQNEPRAGDGPGAISRSRERGRYPCRGFKLKREQRVTSRPFEIKGAVPESPRFLFDTLVGAAAPSARYARTADSIRQRGPGRDGAARGWGAGDPLLATLHRPTGHTPPPAPEAGANRSDDPFSGPRFPPANDGLVAALIPSGQFRPSTTQ